MFIDHSDDYEETPESREALETAIAALEEMDERDNVLEPIDGIFWAMEKLNFKGEFKGLTHSQRAIIICSAGVHYKYSDGSEIHPYSQGGIDAFEIVKAFIKTAIDSIDEREGKEDTVPPDWAL